MTTYSSTNHSPEFLRAKAAVLQANAGQAVGRERIWDQINGLLFEAHSREYHASVAANMPAGLFERRAQAERDAAVRREAKLAKYRSPARRAMALAHANGDVQPTRIERIVSRVRQVLGLSTPTVSRPGVVLSHHRVVNQSVAALQFAPRVVAPVQAAAQPQLAHDVMTRNLVMLQARREEYSHTQGNAAARIVRDCDRQILRITERLAELEPTLQYSPEREAMQRRALDILDNAGNREGKRS